MRNVLIVQHRANDYKKPALADFAEIDVWLDPNGEFRVKHDVMGDYDGPPPILLEDYLAAKPFKAYFVNIKQCLSLVQLNTLTSEYFNTSQKLIGYFDVPQPLAYYAELNRERIFHRRSEFEITEDARYHWVDPLKGQAPNDFINAIGIARGNETYMICCPSLHKATLGNSERVWNLMKEIHRETGRIYGVVTKYPREAQEFFND